MSSASTNEDNSSRSFSVILLETIFLAIMLVVGMQLPLTLAAQEWGLSFRVFLYISPLLTVLCLAVVAWMQTGKLRQTPITRDDKIILAWLCLLGIVCALVVLFTHVSYFDDYYYVPNVVYFLDHISQPMDFKIHFLVGSGGNPIISYNQGTSVAFDYFRGMLAHYSHLNFLVVYYLTDAFAAFLVPAVHFLLLSRFVDRPRTALTGTFIALALILVSVDGFAFGFQVPWTMAEGKRLFLIVGIPLFTAFTVPFLACPTWRGWIALSIVSLAAVSMTPSAANLLAVLAVLLAAAFFLSMRLETGRFYPWTKMALQTAFYLASLAIPFLYALLLYVQLKQGVTTGNPFALPGPTNFMEQVNVFSSLTPPFFLLTPILMVISPILLAILAKGWPAKFILIWTGLLLVFFLNPVAAPLMMNTVVVQNIYWRLFFLAPFPLAGAAAAVLPTARRLTAPIAGGVMAVALLAYLLLAYNQGILSFSVYDLPLSSLDSAQRIVRVAPPGVMLAPANMYSLIPLIDGFHPQIVVAHDGNVLWLNSRDLTIRENASKFTNGKLEDIGDFAQLLQQGLVDEVVFPKSLLSGPVKDQLEAILQNNGFTHRKLIRGYFMLVWK